MSDAERTNEFESRMFDIFVDSNRGMGGGEVFQLDSNVDQIIIINDHKHHQTCDRPYLL